MSFAVYTPYDKSLDERLPRRRQDVARTLRSMRERLASRSGLEPQFERELLVLHALAVKSAAVAVPLPIGLTGLALFVLLGPVSAVLFMALALASYGTLFFVSLRLERRARGAWRPERWRSLFLGAHLVAGGSWAYLATLRCAACGPLEFEIFQFAVLLTIVALTAMITSTLKGVVALAFLPLMVVLGLKVAADPEPVRAAMSGVLAMAIPFFAILGDRLRRNTVERLKSRAEKDELIFELEAARAASDSARNRAEEANLAKSQFLATMSHELRTPLNAILGFSEVIANEIFGPVGNGTYKDYVRDIHDSGEHLLNLINEILDLSRIEAGRYALNEETFSLAELVQECVGVVRLRAEAKSIAILPRFEEDMPLLWADERSVRQIVLNLLSNALKFTPEGGEIQLRVGWTAGGGQYVSIRDNGPGIPEEEIPTVLSSFGQGSIAIKSAEQGTGLGLPIVQALVEMHGGAFELRSKLGEGTEAVAIFPHSRVLEVMPIFDEALLSREPEAA